MTWAYFPAFSIRVVAVLSPCLFTYHACLKVETVREEPRSPPGSHLRDVFDVLKRTSLSLQHQEEGERLEIL